MFFPRDSRSSPHVQYFPWSIRVFQFDYSRIGNVPHACTTPYTHSAVKFALLAINVHICSRNVLLHDGGWGIALLNLNGKFAKSVKKTRIVP